MGLIGTYDGTVRVKDGRVEAGCCCCPPGQDPIADFSYTQTGDEPCVISLTDESTVHENCDGSIVAWKWKKNGVQFSTSQNPTGIEVESGDEIALEVRDSCGCKDEVVSSITCVSWTPCADCPEDTLPDQITVSLTLTTRANECHCDAILDLNPFTLDRLSDCEWEVFYPGESTDCINPPAFGNRACVRDLRLNVTLSATSINLAVTFFTQINNCATLYTTVAINFSVSRSSSDLCLGTHSLALNGTPSSSPIVNAHCAITALGPVNATVTI